MSYRRSIAAIVLAAMPFPAVAQIAPPPPPAATAITPEQIGITTLAAADPARLAAARPVIDQIWPLGTYARVMRTVMDQMAQMMAGKLSTDVVGGDPAVRAALADVAQPDPYADERMRISMHVMGDEMSKFMTKFEPGIRDALASAYARRFTTAQLGELHAFFNTPTGRIYAAETMTISMGPDMIKASQAMMPEMMKEMPAIMAKVEAATKHLPPPPKKKAK